ncbi:MAG: chromate transporter, partial [Burkholderiales bacterium 21-58-4]
MTDQLLPLLKVFGGLSLLAVGGGNALIPDMQRVVVDHYHWVTAREFLDLFTITRATPGPGSTIVLLISQKVAGL